MGCSKSALLAFITQFLVLHDVSTTTIYGSDVSKINKVEQFSEVGWVFDSESALKRSKRAVHQPAEVNKPQEKIQNPFDDPLCRGGLRRLCGNIYKHNDDLLLLECIQTFKVCIYYIYKVRSGVFFHQIRWF